MCSRNRDTGDTDFYQNHTQCPRNQSTDNPCQQHIGETFRNHHLWELPACHADSLHGDKLIAVGNDIYHNLPPPVSFSFNNDL